MRLLSLLLALTACAGGANTDKGDSATDENAAQDEDRDGFFADVDCNDADATTHPDAPELCDGVDNNCDGTVDEDVRSPWYEDADGDGFGDPAAVVEACAPPEGAVANGTDCDDSDPAIFPGAEERCDGIDNNCDGDADDGEQATYYADADHDGYGDPASPTEACEPPDGYVDDDQDCNDASAEAAPGLPELCDELDNDCDGEVDEGVGSTFYEDRDGDTYGDSASTTTACAEPAGYAAEGGDCKDDDPAFYPGAPELDCTDPNDYNCDGSVAFNDGDLDGWPACEDCDDADLSRHPGATEVCNANDDDCDGLTDDADPDVDLSTASAWYADADADLYGDPAVSLTTCDLPTGYVEDDTDCDDAEDAANPGETEVCDAIDNDCDGLTDDDDPSLDLATATLWYRDADGDGAGDAAVMVLTCTPPSGYIALPGDCDDTDPAVHPTATEVCDGIDNDCDGALDDADPSLDVSTTTPWYADADGDLYGDPAAQTDACLAPAGAVRVGTDCDDSAPTVHPGANEVCNSLDDDCDALIDAADPTLDPSTLGTFYPDADHDGYGTAAGALSACAAPTGYAAAGADCDDADAAVHPGATETCDGDDEDCDLSADEGGVCPCTVMYMGGATEHPYQFCTSALPWASAAAACATSGYHLLTVNNGSENAWADSTADTWSTDRWWMGFNDQASEGNWVWTDGAPVTYTNWAGGEPNNIGDEDCGQINRFHPSQTWNDETCSQSLPYVCEAG